MIYTILLLYYYIYKLCIYIYMRYRNKILILIEECKIYNVYKIMK